MDFSLTVDQTMIAQTARRIGEKFGLEYWRNLDRNKAFPTEIWAAICEAGLCGVALPEEHGGAGLGMFELALVVENLAAGGGGSTIGQLFMVNPIFGGISIARFGTPDLKRALLPGLIAGSINFCMALTEPDAGSNSLGIKTYAGSDGNAGWRLTGQKIWITGVPQAQKMLA
jgi:acyl-CoA dehydrogenase